MINHKFQRSRLQLMSLIFVFFFSIPALSEAAVWKNIPALPQAQKIKQEEAAVNNIPVQTTIYTTLTPPQEIAEFYKTKLVGFGWKLGTEANQQGIYVLVFSAEKNEFLNIMVQNILGKNYVTITQSKKPETPTQPCPECNKKMAELKKNTDTSPEAKEKMKEALKEMASKKKSSFGEDSAGKDLQFVPRYPGATRVNDIERDNGRKVNLTYYTKDAVENVINFYRQNMGDNYWKLENEVDFQDLPPGLSGKIEVGIKGKSLVFKNPSASCIISITEDPQNDQGTIIGVNYNEK